ncbi:MAG: glycosyltransferase [Candidatus Saccharimonadales bacterium]
MNAISIVVPTLNEANNVPLLVRRIAASFKGSGLLYEIIFVDDHSIDGTTNVIDKLTDSYPVSVAKKVGPRGKAFSLLQGFKMAQYNNICMIDADLQYPPEAIVPMYRLMTENKVDLVITDREDHETSQLRQLSSKVFNFAFIRLLFGFDYDTQSGLKLFKKRVIEQSSLNPTPWSFDLEFIVRALENNFKILSYTIPFSSRHSGESKVRVFKLTFELAKASLKLRFTSSSSKVKQAYRMNLRIAERVSGILLIPVMGLLAALVLSLPAQASALQLPLVDRPLELVQQRVFPAQPQASSPTTAPQPIANEQPISNEQTTTPVSSSESTSLSPQPQPPATIASAPPDPVSSSQPSLVAGAVSQPGATTYPSLASASSLPTYTQASAKQFNNSIILPLAASTMLGSIVVAARALSKPSTNA